MAATLRDLPHDFGEHFLTYKPSLRQRIQGRRFANGSYCQSVQLYREADDVTTVKCSFFHSRKKTEAPHIINMSLDRSMITDAHCKCQAAVSGECVHVMAIVLKLTDWLQAGYHDIPSDPSCTSLPSQWDKPRGTKILPEPVSTIVLSRSSNSNRKKRPVTALFIDNRNIPLLDRDLEFLSSMEVTPLGYLTSKPYKVVDSEQGTHYLCSTLSHQVPLIQPIQESEPGSIGCGNLDFPMEPDVDNIDIVNDYRHKFEGIAISDTDAVQLEHNTRDQARSDLWHTERKKRITASNFGRIMLRKTVVNEKLINSIQCEKTFEAPSTGYGITHEKVAINAYRKQTKRHVHDCGFIVNPKFPCIGASPDGKICDNGESGILEVKCPYSIRDSFITDALHPETGRKDFFLELTGENITLKKNHNYWFQVQGQLLVTGAKFCDFVTYTRKDLLIIRVHQDKDVMSSIL